MSDQVQRKSSLRRESAILHPGALNEARRSGNIGTYGDGRLLEVRKERKSYELSRSGRYDDGVPVRLRSSKPNGLMENDELDESEELP